MLAETNNYSLNELSKQIFGGILGYLKPDTIFMMEVSVSYIHEFLLLLTRIREMECDAKKMDIPFSYNIDIINNSKLITHTFEDVLKDYPEITLKKVQCGGIFLDLKIEIADALI